MTAGERFLLALVHCFPPGFRREHGKEVRQFIRAESGSSSFTLALDLLAGIGREWMNALIGLLHAPRTTHHAPRPGEPMRNLFRDVRHAVRMLAKSPGFSVAAILTLALGIGANTAMFTLADATLLRPLLMRDPARLVVWSWSSSYPDFQEYMKRSDVFEGVAAVGGGGRLNLVVDGASELAATGFVSGNAFDLFGVSAAHGRLLVPSDDVRNGPLVGVLGYDYWQTRFGADPSVVGRIFRLNGRPVTIVGVLQKGFRGVSLGSNPALYIPVTLSGQVRTGFFARADALTHRGLVWLSVIGRLREGVTADSAAGTMTDLYVQLHPREPGEKREVLRLEPLQTRALGRAGKDVRTFVTVLLGVVGLTLLIGCANLANLLLAKAAVRRSEIGIRLALGATRARIVRLMLAESIVLSAVGGAVGIAVALLTLRMLRTYQLPGGMAIENLRLDLDAVALSVTFGLSLITGLFFGALPAWRASAVDVLLSLREHSRAATSRSAVRGVLLGAQVALSLVLLSGAGLFARSLMSGLNAPLGLTVDGLLTASVNVGLARYTEPRAAEYYASALERVRALPQVSSAAWAGMIPTRSSWTIHIKVEGFIPPSKEALDVNMQHAGPRFFQTTGTRVVAGREFDEGDTASTPLVVVVNDAMARKYWPGRNAIGGRVNVFDDAWATVVGIVDNIVTQRMQEEPVPFLYLAHNQALSGKESVATDPAHLFVRAKGDPSVLVPLVRAQLQAIDPELPVYDIEPFDEKVRALVMPQRMGVTLFTLFSALALALATVGIYGVASYAAAARTREIGLRIALGATRGEVGRMVLRQGIRPVVIGIASGLALALYFSRAARAFLFDVSPFDPLTFAGVTLLLGTVAVAASYLPARRASRIEPVTALRAE